jgi:hypothetical protein
MKRWLLEGHEEPEGFYEREGDVEQHHHQHPWWKVMCLTGVDYFSTLGYQPGIAALAAGALSPVATLVLVLVTLFGALPMYKRVAEESPHGDGSISMLEHLLGFWVGKLFVLSLIGFVATGFVITITLSAADAAKHVAENPFMGFTHGYEIAMTLLLVLLLGAVFLKGFGEAIGIAVVLVALYIGLNLIVIGVGLTRVLAEPRTVAEWFAALTTTHGSPVAMVGSALLVFPRLALGLSGFETGVVVMPLVKGDPGDTPTEPAGRIRNAKRLLTTAALIMSVLLICSSLVTTLLIPHHQFEEGGDAAGRALAFLAHDLLGDLFGTLYDLSTILILWFAGASAMAGLLNIVPRYLPRYGMAPDWTRATRPLVVLFTLVCFAVTLFFRADVEAQAGAYATGVLALMTSATIAVTLSARRKGQTVAAAFFGVVTLVFVYTTVDTVLERPEGLRIALVFIATIVAVSIVSRVLRTTELRAERVVLDERARLWIDDLARGELRIVANQPDARDAAEYRLKAQEVRWAHNLSETEPVLFLEVNVGDPSDFSTVVYVRSDEIGGHRVLVAEGSTVPNTIAAFLLQLRRMTGKIPHAYFQWTEEHPLSEILSYLMFGEGDVAPVTREVLRQAEPEPSRRPVVHVA